MVKCPKCGGDYLYYALQTTEYASLEGIDIEGNILVDFDHTETVTESEKIICTKCGFKISDIMLDWDEKGIAYIPGVDLKILRGEDFK